jgi:LmbE family N-acetylglucosaminyl deacetylase
MKKLLGVFAHPDDESFTLGGTIAKYTKNGWQVDLICATKGEAGSGGQYDAQGDELGNIRQREIRDAAAELGVSSITFLDYKDGTLSNKNPGEIEDKLMDLIAEFTPDVIVTFEPAGISHHPDHIKLTLATTFAFQQYAEGWEEVHPDDPDGPKLYYACIPESVASFLVKKKVFPAESFGKPWVGVEDKRITTVIDVSRTSAVKAKALHAHVSQAEDVDRFYSIDNNPLTVKEYFILRMIGTKEVFVGKNDRISDRL